MKGSSGTEQRIHISCGTPVHMKSVLSSISSLFKRGAGAAQRVAAWLACWLKLDCLCPLLQTSAQQTGKRVAGSHTGRAEGGLSAKTHPLKPKLFLIYMLRLFKTVTSAVPPPPTPASFTLHPHTCLPVTQTDSISCSDVKNNPPPPFRYQGAKQQRRPECWHKLQASTCTSASLEYPELSGLVVTCNHPSWQ